MFQKPKRLVYAYNPKINEISMKKLTSEPNWDIINKVSEVDDLINITKKKKGINDELEKIKGETISNILYNNGKIPDVWKNQISYRQFMIKLIHDNEKLFNYLASVNHNQLNEGFVKGKEDRKTKADVESFEVMSNIGYGESNAEVESNDHKVGGGDFYQTGLGMSFPSKETEPKRIQRNKSVVLPAIRRQSEPIGGSINRKSSVKSPYAGAGIRKIQSEVIGFNLDEPSFNNVSIDANANSPKRRLKSPTRKPKKRLNSQSEFLNVISINRKEVKHPEVKRLVKEVNGFGPRCPHCDSCNNLNVDFLNEMLPEKAIDLLHYIKEKRVKLTHFD